MKYWEAFFWSFIFFLVFLFFILVCSEPSLLEAIAKLVISYAE